MIRCNLSLILAERYLKITKVSNDTGISRTTLTSLCSNESQGIQFETLNTLCNYLRVTPYDLISHIDYDIIIKDVLMHGELNDIKITLNIKDRRIDNDYSLCGSCYADKSDSSSFQLTCSFELPSFLTSDYYLLQEAFKKLPRAFLSDLENNIEKTLKKQYEEITAVNFEWWDFNKELMF